MDYMDLINQQQQQNQQDFGHFPGPSPSITTSRELP